MLMSGMSSYSTPATGPAEGLAAEGPRAAAAAGAAEGTKASTSLAVTLPSGPVPFTAAMSIPFSAALVLAKGLEKTLSPEALGGAAWEAAGDGLDEGFDGAG